MKKTTLAVITFLAIVLCLAAGFGIYALVQYIGGSSQGKETISLEAAEVVSAVDKLMVLPEGEEPTVATVTNLEQLAGQPFFAQAKVGDKVLVYTKARKAILFDPVANKIVEVAPLAIDAVP